eukprot:CAMPEP_0183343352 /NCGR_PEP_ID=MMETSP0164_2-20130417/9288_1 /TAXON_ID=221442 /ORGANISM="Coccolithus pelagicus ssp braarudi, Strain PLY182g" /LENGTH=49 /DNA_ID= /DNA_START= /DNA_END= /DNA_ORIENTATION=
MERSGTRLGAGEVGQPVQEVEGDVRVAHVVAADLMLEAGEEYPRRRLRL